MNNYWLWLFPILMIISVGGSYANSEYNKDSKTIWYIASLFTGLCLTFLWPVVAKMSTDLIRDTLIWSVSIFVCGIVVLFVKGHGSNYTIVQWFGFGLVIVGLILMKKV